MDIEFAIRNSDYPEYIKDYVLRTYENNRELFLIELRKAENNSKRPAFYCRLDLNTISPEDVRFEHFIPKWHITANIVQACKWCDEFKQDRMPEDFESIILNEENVKRDKYAKTNQAREKLIEFAPLVACHSMGNSNPIWIDKMIMIAKEKYRVDLNSIHPGQVRWKYYGLFRKNGTRTMHLYHHHKSLNL